MTGLAELYPFLEPTPRADSAAVLADVTRSTRAKIEEIGALRAAVVEADAARIAGCATAMAGRFSAGGRLFTFGNGGSSTDAAALATLFVDPGAGYRPLPATALADDVATLTALANDVGFEVVFSRPLAAAARERGLLTVGLAGYAGGAMAEAAARGEIEHLFVVSSASVHRIQEAQTTTYHVLWELVQHALGPDRP